MTSKASDTISPVKQSELIMKPNETLVDPDFIDYLVSTKKSRECLYYHTLQQ